MLIIEYCVFAIETYSIRSTLESCGVTQADCQPDTSHKDHGAPQTASAPLHALPYHIQVLRWLTALPALLFDIPCKHTKLLTHPHKISRNLLAT